jgi:hypothetical protein
MHLTLAYYDEKVKTGRGQCLNITRISSLDPLIFSQATVRCM